MIFPSRWFTPAPGTGAGLETPGPLSLGLTPLTADKEELAPPDPAPSLVGGAAPDLSPLFFFPKKKDMFYGGIRPLSGFAHTIVYHEGLVMIAQRINLCIQQIMRLLDSSCQGKIACAAELWDQQGRCDRIAMNAEVQGMSASAT